MTTTAQVRKLVQPILARNADLALVGRWIFVKPVHHFARAILIDRSSSPDELVPQWAVMHLFEAKSFFFWIGASFWPTNGRGGAAFGSSRSPTSI